MAVEYINAAYALPHDLVTSTEMSVLAYLANRANPRGECWPTRASIAAAVRLHEDTVKAVLNSLATKGLLTKSNRMRDGRIESADITLTLFDEAIAWEVEAPPAGGGGSTTPQGGGLTTPEGGGLTTPEGGGSTTPEKYINHQLEPPLEPSMAEPPKRSRPKRTISEGWAPSEIDRAYAAKHRFNPGQIDRMAERFANHAKQVDRKCSDWQAAWRNWVLKEVERQPKAKPKVTVW